MKKLFEFMRMTKSEILEVSVATEVSDQGSLLTFPEINLMISFPTSDSVIRVPHILRRFS